MAELDFANNVITSFVHGSGIDEPLAMARDGRTYTYHRDALGSITHITDDAGLVVQRYAYDAYGTVTAELDPDFIQPYGFTGRERDRETGLLYYRARYYDPKAGRFLSEDPIRFDGGDVNLYAYVLNNPVNLVDPTGEIWNFSQTLRNILRPLVMAVKLLTGDPVQGPPPGMDQMGQPKIQQPAKPTKPPVSGPPPGGASPGSPVIMMLTPCLIAPHMYWINPATDQCELRPTACVA